MNKYKIEMSYCSLVTKKEFDPLQNIVINCFYSWVEKYYNSKNKAKEAIANIVKDLIKEFYLSDSNINQLKISKETKNALSFEVWGMIGDVKYNIANILFYIYEIPCTKITFVVTKSIFGSNNDYLFSETIGKADSQKQAETLRDIDKQKFGDSYECNGWKVHYFFNKVEV